jgi:hypothetical protein
MPALVEGLGKSLMKELRLPEELFRGTLKSLHHISAG